MAAKLREGCEDELLTIITPDRGSLAQPIRTSVSTVVIVVLTVKLSHKLRFAPGFYVIAELARGTRIPISEEEKCEIPRVSGQKSYFFCMVVE